MNKALTKVFNNVIIVKNVKCVEGIIAYFQVLRESPVGAKAVHNNRSSLIPEQSC